MTLQDLIQHIKNIPSQIAPNRVNRLNSEQELNEANASMNSSGGNPFQQIMAPQVGAMPTPEPTPQATPSSLEQIMQEIMPRNPKAQAAAAKSPRFHELQSGAKIAQDEFGVPADMNMDYSFIETNYNPRQQEGGPASGWHQFEQPYPPPIQASIQELFGEEGFDPNSATASARLWANEAKKGMLNRWGVPKDKNPLPKNWGSFENPNNNNGMIKQFYTPEEINPYMAPRFRSTW